MGSFADGDRALVLAGEGLADAWHVGASTRELEALGLNGALR